MLVFSEEPHSRSTVECSADKVEPLTLERPVCRTHTPRPQRAVPVMRDQMASHH